MTKFHCVIDIVFEAEDIDDVFVQLSKHFDDVMESKLEYIGNIKVENE